MKNEINKALFEISKKISEISQIISNNFKSIVDSLDFSGVQKALDSIKIDTQEKSNIETKAKYWAQYELCIPPNVPLSVLNNPPTSNKQAEKICDAYMNEKEINSIFKEIKNLNFVQAKDINEAKFLFKNKKYKSCSMLLFSFIDRIILNSQTIPSTGRRKLPNNIKDIELKKAFDSVGYYYLIKVLLTEILTNIYKNANDFTTQDNTYHLNRNYISHGMSCKKITKYHCIKLLLLVYYCSDLYNIGNVIQTP